MAGWVYELKIRLNSASVGVELKLKLKLSLAKSYDQVGRNITTNLVVTIAGRIGILFRILLPVLD